MQNKELVIETIDHIFHTLEGNTISENVAINKELIGIQMFEEPLIGFGSAEDALFETFKKEDVIGPWFMGPKEWMQDAKTVVSLFFPFTEHVKEANRSCIDGPSPLWLHGRIEGQDFLVAFMNELSKALQKKAIANNVPSNDERFCKLVGGNMFHEYSCVNEKTFGSNWSERHAAYVCGLGTFGLSKGLITRKGMAGRFMSIILNVEIQPDERPYTGVYDYCTQCGACIRRCPVEAISFEDGKDHAICSGWLNVTKEKYAPRYGCGLCQTKVPCESQIPERK